MRDVGDVVIVNISLPVGTPNSFVIYGAIIHCNISYLNMVSYIIPPANILAATL